MPNLSDLKAQLSILRQGWKLVPATSPAEIYLRACEENLILVQIEAEGYRVAIKNEFMLSKKVEVQKGDKRILRTEFGWEGPCDGMLKVINEREIRGITYYETEIRKLYATEQQQPTSSGQQGAVHPVDQQAKI